jgi:hypothetical protein
MPKRRSTDQMIKKSMTLFDSPLFSSLSLTSKKKQEKERKKTKEPEK